MEFSLTPYNISAMFLAMLALAMVPDASAIAVVARSMSSGIKQAAMVIVGIVVADFVLIVFAIYGLASVAYWMGDLFDIIKLLGGVYLIVLGIVLWKCRPQQIELEGKIEVSWLSSFITGFLITMGDPKAILFYMSFLSAFLDVTKVTVLDTLTIMVLVTVVLFSVKMAYAYMGLKSRVLFNSNKASKRINYFSGSVMMITGLYLIIKV